MLTLLKGHPYQKNDTPFSQFLNNYQEKEKGQLSII